jgi:hypothetical protein
MVTTYSTVTSLWGTQILTVLFPCVLLGGWKMFHSRACRPCAFTVPNRPLTALASTPRQADEGTHAANSRVEPWAGQRHLYRSQRWKSL